MNKKRVEYNWDVDFLFEICKVTYLRTLNVVVKKVKNLRLLWWRVKPMFNPVLKNQKKSSHLVYIDVDFGCVSCQVESSRIWIHSSMTAKRKNAKSHSDHISSCVFFCVLNLFSEWKIVNYLHMCSKPICKWSKCT